MNDLIQEVIPLKRVSRNHKPSYLDDRRELISRNDRQLLLKVYFECAKKIYPCWKSEFGNSVMIQSLLQQIHRLLYHQKDTTRYVQQFIRDNQRYFELLTGRLQLMGSVFMKLCYSILSSYEWNQRMAHPNTGVNEMTKTDSPDFLAARVWAGERKFLKPEGDEMKKREFWRWYLNMTYQIEKNPNIPILELEEQNYIISLNTKGPERTQHPFNENIELCFKSIVLMIVHNMEKEEWDCAEIIITCLDDSSMNIYKEQHGRKYVYKLSLRLMNELYEYMEQIHREMYQQAMCEGAWLVCRMKVYPDRTYEVEFNYDDLRSIPAAVCHPAAFVIAFINNPRSREYTPQWWQELLGKNTKYLE